MEKNTTQSTPLMINMEDNHGGLVQIIFISKWVICRFQPWIFQGVFPWIRPAIEPARVFGRHEYYEIEWIKMKHPQDL